ncbi:ACT domain-containing protein [Mycoplasmatota bacterium]|nr:ACT domain-containing protein [Mycoplasmatota bacterium]
MNSKYLVIDKEILPDVFEKVLQAKELLRMERVKEVTEAVKSVGISRSTFYKYKDRVFSLSESSRGKMVSISFLLKHKTGLLSKVINLISDNNGNVLTINQDIPINNVANISITFDITNITKRLTDILSDIERLEGVEKFNLMSME